MIPDGFGFDGLKLSPGRFGEAVGAVSSLAWCVTSGLAGLAGIRSCNDPGVREHTERDAASDTAAEELGGAVVDDGGGGLRRVAHAAAAGRP